MRDLIRHEGAAGFGTRLRRLCDRLDSQIEALYRAHGVTFDPRWSEVVAVLNERGGATVSELATLFGLSHAAVREQRIELLKEGLVRLKADRTDRRRQLLTLSAKGRRLAARLAPLWHDIALATDELLSANAPDLLTDLSRIEAALDGMAMIERVPRETHA